MKFKMFCIVVLFASMSTTNFAIAQTYNGTESAIYDPTGDGRWLISNWNDGKIIARANDGSLTYFNQDASIASLGMAIVGNALYVAGQKSDGSQALFGFDMTINECLQNPKICPLVTNCKVHLFFLAQEQMLMDNLKNATIDDFAITDAELV